MHSALAGAADVCLVPEIPYSLDGIVNKLKEIKAGGRNHAIIVVSEGIKTESGEHLSNKKNMVGEAVYGGIAQYLNDELTKRYNEFQIRTTTLGHIQRSGVPVAFDRLLAYIYGAKAVELLDNGINNQMVIWKNGGVQSVSIENVVKEGTTKLNVNSDYVKAALALGIYVGECK